MGADVGSAVGRDDGSDVGTDVGEGVGAGEGSGVGMADGVVVGAGVGVAVGTGDGAGVGVVVGAVTGGMAFGERAKVLDNCVDTVCNAEGKDAADKTQTLGNVSTAGFVVGGVAIATGVVLLLTAPSDEQEPEARSGWRLLAGGSAGDHAGGFVGLQGSW